MIITIIGAGSLGKAYGGLLSSQHDVHYLMRSEYQDTLDHKGFVLEFKNADEKITIQDPVVQEDPKLLPLSDLVIISLKTTENHQIQRLLAHCLSPHTMVLIVQNGIGNEEWVSQFTQDCPIFCGISTMGARRKTSTCVEISNVGELRIAPFKLENLHQCDKIRQIFSKALIPIPVKIASNYKEIRWQKLLWNIPFSCLSVIYEKEAKMLALEPHLSVVQKIIDELVELAKTQGVHISKEYVANMLEFTRTLKGYYPSMYYDHVQGKTIEKEYILDNVLKVANQDQKETPTLKLIDSYLTQKIQSVDSGPA